MWQLHNITLGDWMRLYYGLLRRVLAFQCFLTLSHALWKNQIEYGVGKTEIRGRADRFTVKHRFKRCKNASLME